MATSPVSKPVTPLSIMDGASLRVNMCSAINAASQKAWAFAPYPSDTPDMLVHLWPGALLVDGQPVEVATQATGAFAAPTVHPRIDRIVIDARTGALAVVAGVEAATPARPNVPAGKLPVARVRFSVGMTAISEGDIDDERVDSGGAPLGSLTSPSPYDAASTQDVVTAISAIPQADLVAHDQCALLYLFIMEVVEVPGATGLIDTNYEGKVEAALKFLEHGDFAFVHLEGPDECGHAGDAAEKIEAIRRFDARIVAPLRQALAGQDAAFVVTCDHFTPIAEKTHTPDPVPFLLWRAGGEPSGVAAFSEAEARAAGLEIEAGHELLPWVLRQLA